jgi:hypothetical protein
MDDVGYTVVYLQRVLTIGTIRAEAAPRLNDNNL